MFYQILKGFHTSNLFETCFMVANDDLEGKTTHFTGFLYQYNFQTKNPKTNHSEQLTFDLNKLEQKIHKS